MSQPHRASIQECFSELTDPRRRKVIYPLVNVVTIAICAVLCGARNPPRLTAVERQPNPALLPPDRGSAAGLRRALQRVVFSEFR